MSTLPRVRLASCAVLLTAGAACDRAPAVSYDGLDRPVSWYDPPPVSIGVIAGPTGPEAQTAFSDALRAAFGVDDEDGEATDPRCHVHVLDDRGTASGVQGAAARLEGDLGVHLALVAPGANRFSAAAELAPRTVVVCAGCDASEALREGAFAFELVGGDPRAVATAAAAWIRAAMRGEKTWTSRQLAARLRATRPERGTFAEGASAPIDPFLFREPPRPAARP